MCSNLTELTMGTWRQRRCPDGYVFDDKAQRCEEQRVVRRQQAQCALQGCQQPCTGTPPPPPERLFARI